MTRALVAWYHEHKRDLPWRQTREPYAIWLSEMMLQQTRVETVIPYYQRFLARFPNVIALAESPLEDVLTEWSGLGYYRRARMLHAAAQVVCEGHAGKFPKTAAELETLPGIGRYTAGAIASIAWGERAPLVDGNVARVLSRAFALEEDPARGEGKARVWELASALVPDEAPGDFNQGLMELGATVCTPRAPRCPACPWTDLCAAKAANRAEDFPRLAPKKPPIRVALTALVARSGDAVLLARRAPSGLFAGLWEPPCVPREADPRHTRTAFRALLNKVPRALEVRGAFEHVLTHRRLRVEVVEGTLRPSDVARVALSSRATYDDVRLVSPIDLPRMPRSALAERILRVALVGP